MSFKTVWGFDPDEVIEAQKLGRASRMLTPPHMDSEEQRPPDMPLDVYAHV